MRAKWSAPIRKYWKISEQMMVKYCDLAICDSVNIEKYIHECYDGKGIKGRNPKTTFIAYGADLTLSKLADDDEKLVSWYKEKGLTKKNYYLVVGRFVPENSFEVMIREFMKSKSQKDFAIITNVNDKFLNELEEKLHFKSDKRIKFVGTVYDQELLKKIRENAYAYFHGHTVGGTNPSLIEALGSTDLNLLVDVGFNKEVAEDCALYWSRKPGSLAKLIDKADQMSADEIAEMGKFAQERINIWIEEAEKANPQKMKQIINMIGEPLICRELRKIIGRRQETIREKAKNEEHMMMLRFLKQQKAEIERQIKILEEEYSD